MQHRCYAYNSTSIFKVLTVLILTVTKSRQVGGERGWIEVISEFNDSSISKV